jgi:hypothetical protein
MKSIRRPATEGSVENEMNVYDEWVKRYDSLFLSDVVDVIRIVLMNC